MKKEKNLKNDYDYKKYSPSNNRTLKTVIDRVVFDDRIDICR